MHEYLKAARDGAAKRLKEIQSGDPHEKVDASSWTPPEQEGTTAKTGMRPVSKRAYKSGGKVQGHHAKKRHDRMARKSGGKAGDAMPMVDRFINRDLKKANDLRDGEKHVGALRRGGKAYCGGGRTKKNVGGGMPYGEGDSGIPVGSGRGYLARQAGIGLKHGGKAKHKAIGGAMNLQPGPVGLAGARPPVPGAPGMGMGPSIPVRGGRRPIVPIPGQGTAPGSAPMMRKSGGKAGHPDVAEDKKLIKSMVKAQALKGRSKHADGRAVPMPPNMPDDIRAARMAAAAASNRSRALPGDDVVSGSYGARPENRKSGGKTKWIQSAIKHPGALHKALHVPAGEKIPAKKLEKAAHSDNPKLAKQANLAKTLSRMHRKDGGKVFEGSGYPGKVPGAVGGRTARATGGKAGKGKTNINIMIHPKSDMDQMPMDNRQPMVPTGPMPGAMPPGGLPQGGMPSGGMPMAGGAPTPRPQPAPTGAGVDPNLLAMMLAKGGGGAQPAAPMMRRATGGRAYPIDSGAGGGEARLEKIPAYGLKMPTWKN